MISERTVDIFEQDDLDIIFHQANCMCTMGSGIAKIIRERFPEAYEADCKTVKGDLSKLGSYSVGHICRGGMNMVIINLYGQGNFTNRKIGKRDTSYDALYDAMKLALTNLVKEMPDELKDKRYKIGIPHGMGCALGGGSWIVVRAMVEDIFSDCEFDVVICKLPQ